MEPASPLLPQRKVASGALGGAAAAVALWAIGLTGLDIPPAIAAAIAALITSGVAYLVPSETP